MLIVDASCAACGTIHKDVVQREPGDIDGRCRECGNVLVRVWLNPPAVSANMGFSSAKERDLHLEKQGRIIRDGGKEAVRVDKQFTPSEGF